MLPGRHASGKAGEDYVLGEEAVLQYFMDSISERVDGDGELLGGGGERARGDDGELVLADGGERVYAGGGELVRGGGGVIVDGDDELRAGGGERSRGDDGELVRADGGERVHVGGVELVRGGGDERIHAGGDGELVCADGGERVHAAGGGELRSSGETCVGVEPIRRSSGETDSRGRESADLSGRGRSRERGRGRGRVRVQATGEANAGCCINNRTPERSATANIARGDNIPDQNGTPRTLPPPMVEELFLKREDSLSANKGVVDE